MICISILSQLVFKVYKQWKKLSVKESFSLVNPQAVPRWGICRGKSDLSESIETSNVSAPSEQCED